MKVFHGDITPEWCWSAGMVTVVTVAMHQDPRFAPEAVCSITRVQLPLLTISVSLYLLSHSLTRSLLLSFSASSFRPFHRLTLTVLHRDQNALRWAQWNQPSRYMLTKKYLSTYWKTSTNSAVHCSQLTSIDFDVKLAMWVWNTLLYWDILSVFQCLLLRIIKINILDTADFIPCCL